MTLLRGLVVTSNLGMKRSRRSNHLVDAKAAKVVYQSDFLVVDWILGSDQNEKTIKQHNNI